MSEPSREAVQITKAIRNDIETCRMTFGRDPQEEYWAHALPLRLDIAIRAAENRERQRAIKMCEDDADASHKHPVAQDQLRSVARALRARGEEE